MQRCHPFVVFRIGIRACFKHNPDIVGGIVQECRIHQGLIPLCIFCVDVRAPSRRHQDKVIASCIMQSGPFIFSPRIDVSTRFEQPPNDFGIVLTISTRCRLQGCSSQVLF